LPSEASSNEVLPGSALTSPQATVAHTHPSDAVMSNGSPEASRTLAIESNRDSTHASACSSDPRDTSTPEVDDPEYTPARNNAASALASMSAIEAAFANARSGRSSGSIGIETFATKTGPRLEFRSAAPEARVAHCSRSSARWSRSVGPAMPARGNRVATNASQGIRICVDRTDISPGRVRGLPDRLNQLVKF
jgi:hypothetical protein